MKMGIPPFSFIILNPLLLLLLILSLFGCPRGSSGCIERERLALLDFKKSFVSTIPNDMLSSWKSSEEDDCCNSWNWITCDNFTGLVVSLSLAGQLLKSNNLRPSLLVLQHLEILILEWNDFSMKIPEFIGSFSKLTYLSIWEAGFYGKIPPHIGNLSSIQVLNLRDNNLFGDNFQWLSKLSTLEQLLFEAANFSEAKDWLSAIKKLPLLSTFACSNCSLPPPFLSSTNLDRVNSSNSLQNLELSESILSRQTILLLMNVNSNLSTLLLSNLYLEGPFPDIFHNMMALETIDVSGNYIKGSTFKSIGNLPNLRSLSASGCCTNQTIVDVLQALLSFADSSLEKLDLSSNNFTGTIPPMLKFPSLKELYLSNNRLESFPPQNSTNPPKQSLHRFPSSLASLDLSSNFLQGVFSDAYFSNLSNLVDLELSNNPNLTISFIEPLPQLKNIVLRSCKLGPKFPRWLLSQYSYARLDLSSSLISGSIPVMFWRNLPLNLKYLNISCNKFHDRVPNETYNSVIMDLSSNNFYGPIPFSILHTDILHLSKNNFSSIGPIPHSSNLSRSAPSITTLDISDNCLSGVLPDQFWSLVTGLGALNLANNNLSGTIPSSIGDMSLLYVLILNNNSFSGQLPLWLGNCSYLRILDLSKNHFTGSLPSWIGKNLANMVLLSLGSNYLSGTLPKSLFHLNSLQIIDLSNNTLYGNIPSSVKNFTAMVHDDYASSLDVWDSDDGYDYYKSPTTETHFYQAFIKWKGIARLFKKSLQMVKLIDFSSNNLSGEIPSGLASLSGLNSLDLSNNHFSGSIPKQTGQLRSLEVLNLHNNRLCGEIPSSLASIYSLDVLNVSHNNLSGKIPTSTQLQSFDPSAYAGNPKLCGSPLSICPGDEQPSVPLPPTLDANEIESKQFDMQSFYAAMGIGFAFGFLVVVATLSFIANWRRAFFGFASDFLDWILLVVALSCSRISKKFHFG